MADWSGRRVQVSAIALGKTGVFGLVGAIVGGIVLAVDGLLLSRPSNLGFCFLIGGIAGAGAELLAHFVSTNRINQIHWLLVAFGAWAVIEALTVDSFMLAALITLTVIGGSVGALVYVLHERLTVGSGP